jgi:cytoskeletal protein CcmA (bactofilin family)
MFTTKPKHELDDAADINSASTGSMAAGERPGKMARSIICEDLSFIGNIVDTGEIELLGKLEGDVQCGSILIGEKAQIVGTVTAQDVVVRGRVVGLIRGLRVTLEAQAYVEGEIHYQSLGMEHGVHFDGKGRRVDAPLMAVSQGETAPSSAEEHRLELLPRPQSAAAE